MSNVSNPSGPINPTNPQRSTEPAKPGTDKFKELMKVDKSDEKQKKRKKRSEEIEEEEKAKLRAGATPAGRNTEAAKRAEKFPKIQKVGESEKKQPQHQKRSEEIEAEEEATLSAASAQKKPFEPSSPVQGIEKAEEDAATHAAASLAQSLSQDLDQIIEEEQQLAQKEESTEGFKQADARVEERKKKETSSPSPALGPATSALGPSFLPPTTEVPPAYTLLSAEAFALFEKMVSVITVLQASGMTETVIHLNTPEFTNSPFSESQIIIREYSTAPLSYNVELIGNPAAADLFRRNIPLLKKAFDEGKYRFRINRLESSLSPEETPKVRRKRKKSDEE